jgi:hypothetical protein
MTTLLRATMSFFIPSGRQVKRNELVRADDPIIKGREQFFEAVSDVERATAAPGEKRTVTRRK